MMQRHSWVSPDSGRLGRRRLSRFRAGPYLSRQEKSSDLRFLVRMANDLGGVAGNDGAGGYVLGDDGSGGDDGAPSHGNALEDNGVEANPDVIAKDDGLGVDFELFRTGMPHGHDGTEVAMPHDRVRRMAVG